MSPLKETDQVRTHQVTGEDARSFEPTQRSLNLLLPVQGDKPDYPPGFELVWADLARCPGFHALMAKNEAFSAYDAIRNREPDADLCRAARTYGRHLGDLNRKRPVSDPHPMRSPARWFSTGYYRQFLGGAEPLAEAADPATLAAADRARLAAAGFGGPEIEAWFAHAEFALVGEELRVTVRKPFVRNWVANHFAGKLEKAWAADGARSVVVIVAREAAA